MPVKIVLALLFGVLLGISWPTAGFTPFIFIAIIPLLWLLELSKNDGFWIFSTRIFLGFFVWNAIATWWLWNATVFGMFFAIFINCLMMTIVILLWRRVDRKLGRKAGFIFLPLAWICYEKLHLNWGFSWPWLNLGNGFANNLDWVQWYEYSGAFGGTLWIWVVNLSGYHTIKYYMFNKKLGKQFFKTIALILIPLGLSLFIKSEFEQKTEKTLTVTLIQPNIDPYEEKYEQTNQQQYELLIHQTSPELNKNPDVIITPETYFSEGAGTNLSLIEDSKLYQDLLDYAKINNTQFLNGTQLYKTYLEEDITKTANKLNNGVWVDFYNSAFLTDTTGVQIYHKSKLVAGVETLPFRNIIEPLLGNVMLDFGGTVLTRATQDEREAFPLYNGVKISPIICYESVYGEFVTGYVRNGAEVLAIMTNDAWWGDTPGYRQHLAYASLRAIETRRAIVRSANTGVSAFITPLGEVTSKLPYNTKGVLTSTVYPQSDITLYVRYGDYIFRLAGFVAGLLFLFSFSRRKN
jgi:apolipoprotein N-acyltransferase